MRNRRLLFAVLAVALLVIVGVGCTAKPTTTPNVGGASGSILNQEGGRISSAPYTVAAMSGSQQVGIWVTGEGKVTVVPDLAILQIGVEAQGIAVETARSQATKAMDAVMAMLDKYGVDKKDIKTQQFNIYPVRKWVKERDEEITVGYRVTNMVTVKIRKLEDAGRIIDDAVKAGGDLIRVQGVSFTVDNPDPKYDEARGEAVTDAKTKAQQMATLLGVKLGKPLYVSEAGGYFPPVRAYKTTEEGMAADSATPISPGETEISLSVQIVFAIE